MTKSIVTQQELDEIIKAQMIVAWAGEALSEPPRLGWWRTDLADEMGGGDLFRRIMPRTWRWASLEAIRQAAIFCDYRKREQLAEPEQLRTLFFWGFELDELLQDRIRELKEQQKNPKDSLSIPIDFEQEFDVSVLEQVLLNSDSKQNSQTVNYTIKLGGREIPETLPDSLIERVHNLTQALLPIADEYPMPFYRV